MGVAMVRGCTFIRVGAVVAMTVAAPATMIISGSPPPIGAGCEVRLLLICAVVWYGPLQSKESIGEPRDALRIPHCRPVRVCRSTVLQ